MSTRTAATPSRASFAERQAAVVAALLGEGPVPDGFDATRVHAAAEAIAAKRARAALNAWPGLRTMPGGAYRRRFDAYAAVTPLPARGGPLADGRRFVRTLEREGPLDPAVAAQALAFDQRWRLTATGTQRRRLPRFALLRLPSIGLLILAAGQFQWRLRWPVRSPR